jgi:hypothetical protein
MRALFRLFLVCAATAAIALLSGCSSTMTVNYDFDVESDFNYRTYRWMAHATGLEDGMKRSIPTGGLIDKRIRAAADNALVDVGLTVFEDSPDLRIIYHIGTQEKIQATSYGYSYYPHYYGWGGYYPYYSGYSGHRVDVYEYTEGTLVLDLVDARTDQLVWRGYVTDTIEENPSPERMSSRLNEAFQRMLSNYPPPQ